MVPASTYRIAAGVTALVCFTNLALDLLAVFEPASAEAVRITNAALGVVMSPLFAMQALFGADLACRKLHPLLLAKSRRMAVIGFLGATIAAPLALGRLILAGLPAEVSGVHEVVAGVLWIAQGAILALVIANAKDGFRFASLRNRAALTPNFEK